jgi:hypothetical protein
VIHDGSLGIVDRGVGRQQLRCNYHLDLPYRAGILGFDAQCKDYVTYMLYAKPRQYVTAPGEESSRWRQPRFDGSSEHTAAEDRRGPKQENNRRATLEEYYPYRMEEEQDRTALWLAAIEALIHESRGRRAPALPDLVHLLNNVPHALKRWRWEGRGRRGAAPSRWLLDDERDVQALLWAILAPVYGTDLVDEQHLPGWGGVQPRADLGVLSLRVIIEVKVVRSPADFRAVEEGIAADAGLYFREPGRFERMVVVVYDDSDRPQPERYATLTAALKRRERVADAVILRRPSMLPDRNARA